MEVDLVGADAEAADYDEVFGFFEDAGGELGFGADADDVDVAGVGLVCVFGLHWGGLSVSISPFQHALEALHEYGTYRIFSIS